MSGTEKFASERGGRYRVNNFEMLDILEFSFLTPPNNVKSQQAERISRFDTIPPHLKVLYATYYALELSNPMLKPLDSVNDGLASMKPGTDDALSAINDWLIATSVQAEIEKSYESYDRTAYQLVVDGTSDYSVKNFCWLRAIQKMRNASDQGRRIAPVIGRDCEAIARLTIARRFGVQILDPTRPRTDVE